MTDNEKHLAEAIKAVQAGVRNAHSEAMASQSLLVGLMLALKQNGTNPAVFERAFEFAENLATASAYHFNKEDKHGQTMRTMEIIDSLQAVVLETKN